VLPPGAADFNLDRLSGDTATASALRDAVGTLPVLADRRLVILRDPELRSGARGAELTDALVEIVAELSVQQSIVLVVTAARVDGRAKWVKAFVEPAARVDCEPPRGQRALASFVQREASRQGVALDNDAIELFLERIGPQLMMLRQEIAKAALLAGPGQPVSRAHVDVATSPVVEQPIWQITDAIGEGRGADALLQLSRMIGTGAPAMVVLGSLAAHFRKLARLRSGGNISGPPFLTRKLESQARRYTLPRLMSCLDAIHQTDVALKGATALKPELALERLVIGLTG
jgi:DNA polymerase-3 subunit delta